MAGHSFHNYDTVYMLLVKSGLRSNPFLPVG